MFTFLPGPFLVQFSGPFYLSTDSWRSRCNKSTLSSVIPELPAATSGLSGQFIELSINEPEQSLNLQEVTLKFSNLSISMQGQIKSSVLISVVKTLEEVC